MREIKFRAWDRENKTMLPELKGLELKNEQVVSLREPWGDWEDAGYYDVMQYTGLKDWHKQDIYEGDIVRFKMTDRTSMGGVIPFEDEVIENMWDIRDHDWAKGGDYDDIEVIGNIYENPELIK